MKFSNLLLIWGIKAQILTFIINDYLTKIHKSCKRNTRTSFVLKYSNEYYQMLKLIAIDTVRFNATKDIETKGSQF